jgi:hypothetical protein
MFGKVAGGMNFQLSQHAGERWRCPNIILQSVGSGVRFDGPVS